MSQGIPSIKSVMTSFPFWIEDHAKLDQALGFMKEKGIHHLPVKKEGEVVGVITRRDIEKYQRFTSTEDAVGESTITDIYIRDPYIVDLDELLDNVLLYMSTHHIGSALVTKNGRLAGLFTTNDACRTFGEYLQDHFRPQNGDDAA